jgi:hypothetical protein
VNTTSARPAKSSRGVERKAVLAMPREVFLRCTIKEGMFSDEVVVEVRRKKGGSQTFVVDKTAVNVDAEGCGRVRASVVRRNDTTWAVLPTEYRETIPAMDEDLVEA